MNRELIISSVTPGVYQEVLATYLLKSLEDFPDLDYKVIELPAGSSWESNINNRWKEVLRLAQALPNTDFLCIDADEKVLEDPWPLLRRIRRHCDFGACIMRGLDEPESLLGATVFLPACKNRTSFLFRWIEENEAYPEIWDQVNLQNLMGSVDDITNQSSPQPENIERFAIPHNGYKHASRGVRYLKSSIGFVWAWLPVEYGAPFDREHRRWLPNGLRPIIEHYHVGQEIKGRK